MKLFDEWKLKRKCIKEGRKEEYEEYLKAKDALLRDKKMYEDTVRKAKIILDNARQTYGEESEQYKKALNGLKRQEYSLNETILAIDFVRPNKKEDVEYRKRIIDEFSDSISKILEGDISIRFHGTSIFFTREILKNGGISSTVSRSDGYNSSTDLEDEISVTSSSTINRTLSFFTDLYSFQRSMPSGCLFVLKSNSEVDDELVKYDVMKSFSFKKEPERLLGICTTEENIERVKGWLKEYGYSDNLVHTFESFLKLVPSLKPAKAAPPAFEEPRISNINNNSFTPMMPYSYTDEFESEVFESKGKSR